MRARFAARRPHALPADVPIRTEFVQHQKLLLAELEKTPPESILKNSGIEEEPLAR